MLLELIILITGLTASYLVIQSAYGGQSLVKLLTATFTIFMSLMILFGYYFDRFGMPVFSGYAVVAFLLVAGILLLKNRRPLRLDVEVDKKFTLGFAFVVLVGFFVYILPSLSSFFPVSRITDSGMHYAISKFIAEHNLLLFNGSPYTLFPEWNQYPFGLHLNVAFVSRLLNLDPIVTIYPFIVFISVLTAAVVYGLVVESKIGDQLFELLPAFIALSFYLPNDMIRIQGTWAMAFGIFLVLMFVWLLMDYVKNPRIIGLMPLAIIEIAIFFSYIYWVVIPPLIFLFILLQSSEMTYKNKCTHLIAFSVVVGVFALNYALTLLQFGKLVLKGYKISFVRFLPFDFFGWRIKESAEAACLINAINSICTLFFTISLIGAIKSALNKKNKILLSFFAAVLLQTIVLGICVGFFGFRVYPYSKAYYLLTYPAAIFLFVGLKELTSRLDTIYSLKDSPALKATFVAILVMSVIITGQFVSKGVEMSGNQELAITPDQYDVALWSKNNLPAGNLTYLGATPQDLWFYIISGHTPADPTMVQGPPIDEYFEKWNSTAETGGKVVILDIHRASNVKTEDFDVVYKKGNAIILEKK